MLFKQVLLEIAPIAHNIAYRIHNVIHTRNLLKGLILPGDYFSTSSKVQQVLKPLLDRKDAIKKTQTALYLRQKRFCHPMG